jgi:hypothetical protein
MKEFKTTCSQNVKRQTSTRLESCPAWSTHEFERRSLYDILFIHLLTVSADYLVKADDVIKGIKDACAGKRQTERPEWFSKLFIYTKAYKTSKAIKN